MPVLEKRKVKAATIYEVAKLAGVSPVTVARVYNRKLPVAEETNHKILDAAAQLNFKPNMLARGLKGGKTNSIAILWSLGFPMLPDHVFFELMSKARSKGFYLQFIGCGGGSDDIIETLNECAARGIDAVGICSNSNVVNDACISLLKKFSAAVIIGDTALQTDIDQVVWDRTKAIDEMLSYFKSQGRKKPSIIMHLEGNKVKLDAFMQYAFRHGFSVDSSSIIDVGLKAGANLDCFEEFFESYLCEKKCDRDALLCINDEQACVTVSKLIEHGFKVPQDVAVAGFNNSSISRLFSPKLATVDRCHDELGGVLEKMLFARLENKDLPVQINRVEMRFVPRASAGI